MGVKKIFRKITRFQCERVYKKKKRKDPSRFLTLRQLCDRLGVSLDNATPEVALCLDTTVSHISRYGDRLFKDAVCVQLYEDTDNIMKKAVAEGALVCIADHKIDGIPCITVNDPAAVYTDMAALYGEVSRVKTVAISGSIGKTTAKKMVEAVFTYSMNTVCDSGNANLLDSAGFVAQHLPKKAEVLIAECSEDTPGMLTHMSRLLRPDIAILTPIDKSHILHYGSQENILREIASITDALKENGTVITSMDEENTFGLIRDKAVLYVSAKSPQADYYAEEIRVENDGLHFVCKEKKTGESYPVFLKNVYGLHNVYPALLAFAAGVTAGIPKTRITEGLARYRTLGIRQNAYKTKGVIVYADCYNAVAKSVRSAVEACSHIPVKGKKVAVLGDIAEAGDFSKSTHDEIADIVENSDFKVFLAFGPQIIAATERNTFRSDLTVVPCHTRDVLNANIKKYTKRGDLILFKSSHSGMLQHSLRVIFPLGYLRQGIIGLLPKIKWHFKIISN